MTLGADALAKDNLLVKDRRDFDFNVAAQLDLERNVYPYLEAAALQMVELTVGRNRNLYLVPVEVDLRFAAAGACIDAVSDRTICVFSMRCATAAMSGTVSRLSLSLITAAR